MVNKLDFNLIKQSITKYSRFVFYAKRICLIVTFILIIQLLIIPIINPSNKQVDLLSATNSDPKNRNLLRIDKPNFYSFSSKYGPYNITADKVNRNLSKSFLFDIKAFFTDYEKIPVTLTSEQGILYDENERLTLIGKVNVKYSDYVLTTEKLFAEINAMILYTPLLTNITQGESFLISDQGFKSNLDQKKCFFWGPINLNYKVENENNILKIKSARLDIDHNIKNATFYNNVHVIYDDLTIDADKMVYDYSRGKRDDSKIYFYDNVKFVTKDETIYGNYGIFNVGARTLTMSKGVRIIKDKSKAEGKEFIYSFKNKTGQVSGSPQNRVKANIVLDKK